MRRMVMLAGTALASIPAWADVPAALDRVPNDALVVAAIRDLEQFDTRVGKLMTDLKVPQDAGEMAMAFKLMKTPGLNRKGSMALALLQDPKDKAKEAKPAKKDEMEEEADEDGEQGPLVLIVPVSDQAAFLKAFGAEAGKGVIELKTPDGQESPFDGPMFAKDIGGGYLALGPVKEIVEKFEGAAGHLAAHKAALGPVGTRIADTTDTVIISNIQALGPKMKEGFQGFKQQMQMAMMMGGQQNNEKAVEMVESTFNAFSRDATVGVMGVGIDDAGVWLDLGAQFKEGSASAKLCQTKGKAAAFAGRLPDQPYLATFSVDTSGPNVKQMMGELAKLSDGKSPSMFDNFTKGIDKLDGTGVVIGQTAGMLSGGLLANGVVYAQTSDPAGYTKAMRDSITGMNGKTDNGMTFKTTYEPAAAEISGVKVDKYAAQITVDPNSPNGQQSQQGVMMMYGPAGGPSGFVATLDNAVVMTMAQNTPLMTMALDAAKGKKTLGENSDYKNAGAKLQSDRTAEGYLNVKPLMDLAAMFMGGGGKTPASLPPIAMGITNNDGGMHTRLYVPKSVIAAIKDMAGGGEAEAEDGAAPAEKDAKPPRF